MKIRFTKMHGLGNDFVMLDGVSQKLSLTPEKVRKIADRHFGVGCDQVLMVEPPLSAEADFRYRIFNHDGSEVENCGNGARCFAVFVRQRKLTGKHVIRAETAGGDLILKVQPNHQVTVDMGVPRLQPKEIPFQAEQQQLLYPLPLADRTLQISAVSMGNPHAVTQVDDVQLYDVAHVGPQVERHQAFPARVNAGFMQILNADEIRVRVYERGVGETLACGTGACAAVVAGRLNRQLNEAVAVHLPGGTLQIQWPGPGESVLMTGPAATVFHGQINL